MAVARRQSHNRFTMNLVDLAQQAQAAGGPDRSGTQSLARGIKLMRMIAARPGFGWRLSDLAAACQQVTLMVAGVPLTIKAQAPRHDLGIQAP